jgi:flagellar biosynthesis GTPase FlhF
METETNEHSTTTSRGNLFFDALEAAQRESSGSEDELLEILTTPEGGSSVRRIRSLFCDSSSSSADEPAAAATTAMLSDEEEVVAATLSAKKRPAAQKRRPRYRLTLKRAPKRQRRETAQPQLEIEEEEEEEELELLPLTIQRDLLQQSSESSEDAQQRRKQPRRVCHTKQPYRDAESDDDIVPERDFIFLNTESRPGMPVTPRRTPITESVPLHINNSPVAVSQQQKQRAPLHQASANLYDFVLRFMQQRIQAQPVALSRLAAQLAALLTRQESIYGQDRALLSKLVLCGPTGCGKTETTLALKHLMGMSAGYEYERQCVEIDGSTMGNETQINCLTGGAAGLVGYRDGGSLAERLLKALHDYNTGEWQQLQQMSNKRSKEYRDAKQAYEQKLAQRSDEERYPPWLLLLIDEVDKVAPEFMLNINGLLETGHYQTPSGISFVLPRQTRLLIVMTSNYGDGPVALLQQRDTGRAIKLVEQAMQEAGLSKFTVERMGEILVYWPLSQEILRKILTEKLLHYLQQMSLSMWKKFGGGGDTRLSAENFILCSETLRGVLINKVLDEIDTQRGLRNALRKLYETLETLFVRATGELTTLIHDRRLTVPLQQALCFKRCQLSPAKLQKHLQLSLAPTELQGDARLQHHILQRLCDDPLNQERVDLCTHLAQKIDSLSLTVAEFPLVSVVLAPHTEAEAH